MERSLRKSGLANLLALLAVGVAAFFVSRIGHSLAGLVSSIFMGIGVLISAVSWFQMRLEEREKLEQLEFDELKRSKSAASLFQTQDEGSFPAKRARAQFDKWMVPAFTICLAIIEAVATLVLWKWLGKPETTAAQGQPMASLFLFGLFFLVLFLVGRFTAAIARMEDGRLLRPGASFVLLSAYASLIALLAALGLILDFEAADLIAAKILCALLGVVSVETVANLIFEVYRPRVRGQQIRPLYESRLVGLVAHPEDVFSTAAHALDYQFGFKVSETWFYQFMRRAVGWLLLLQGAVLLLSTTFVVIEPGERGLLERWGRFVDSRGQLGPGVHLKLPWPIDQVKRYRTEQLQTFYVGSQPDPAQANQRTVLWNVKHTKEELVLVANREQGSAVPAESGAERLTPPVSLLTVSFPLQFEIKDVVAWAYNNREPAVLLKDLATREVIRFLAQSDINELMASGRLEAAANLRRSIQARAEERKLGVQVNYIGLHDIHPPVAVAPDFQNVVGAVQKKEASILSARADAIRTNAFAGAEAFRLTSEAEADLQRAQVNSIARSVLFTNQIPAYRAAPSVYRERTYLNALIEASSDARKYLLLTTNTQDVIQFDLQDSIAKSLLDVKVPPPE